MGVELGGMEAREDFMNNLPQRALGRLISAPTLGLAKVLNLGLMLGLMLGLTGCVDESNVRQGPTPRSEARAYMNVGNFPLAAQQYLKAAGEADEDDAQVFRILSAHAWLSANERDAARKAVATLSTESVSATAKPLVDLLRARLTLDAGQPEQALAMLPPPAGVSEELQIIYAQTKVTALQAGGPSVELARTRVDLDFMLFEPAPRTVNHQAIWKVLADLDAATLNAVRANAPDTFTGWIELGEIKDSYGGDVTALRTELDRWQLRYPGHPAWYTIVPEIIASSEQLSIPADHVTLLLPLSGRFAGAGAAVRDGFIAAWLSSRADSANATVTVVDTMEADAGAQYRAAVESGAQFIVGPLRKEAVQSVVALGAIDVPTLALNAVEWPKDSATSRPSALFEVALSPEQEAEQVAERIWYDGHVRAALISPRGGWGTRVGNAFVEAFERLGGRIVERQDFEPKDKDFSKPVALMLNIDESEARFQALKTLLARDIKHEVRRRQDVDAIFMAGFSDQARLLRPQLRFHRASRVPVYSTSHVYGGQPNPQADRDIDGVMFGDMPWLLDANVQTDPIRRELLTHWPSAMEGYSRLFALGADASALVTQLGKLRSGTISSYDGYTGELSVNGDNQVVRKLRWAQFKGGLPTSIDGLTLPGAIPGASQ
jgi:uncharacterized protein